MSQKQARAMTRLELEDEVMLLRAQVKVLQDWVRLAKQIAKQSTDQVLEYQKFVGIGTDYVGCG